MSNSAQNVSSTDTSKKASLDAETYKQKTKPVVRKYKGIIINTKQKGVDIERRLTPEEYQQLEEIIWKLFRMDIELELIYSQGEC